MKIKTFFLFVVLLLFASLQGAKADEAFRKHRFDTWKVLGLPENAIVFVGNSITDMHCWTEAFGNDPRVVNRGNSGGYSFEILDNVESWSRFKPAKVFIKIGTNDLGTSYNEQSIADNISKTVETIRRESPSTEIYLQSILPAYDQNYKTLATIQAANKLIKAIADANEKTTYIDLYSKMGGIRDGAPYSLDRIHLEAYGYKIWVDAIKEYVGIESSYPDNTQTIQNTAELSGVHGMRATYFSVLPTKSTDILFFGDEMVKNGEWNELLNNANVKNRGAWWGYGGNIATVSKYIDAAFSNSANGVTRENPAKIILYTGTEDLNGSTELSEIETNYTALVKKLKTNSPTSKIALVSLMPTSSANTRITEFNSWLKTTAEADDTLTYVDIYTDLASNGVANSNYFSGNYLYGKGYVVVARKLAEFIGSESCKVITDDEAQSRKDLFEARATLNNAVVSASSISIGDALGQYSSTACTDYLAAVESAKTLLSQDLAASEYTTAATTTSAALTTLKANINTPSSTNVTDKQFTICATLRNGQYAYAASGAVAGSTTNPGYATFRWTLTERTDGTYDIKNVGTGTYLDPTATYNTQIKLTETAPETGWTLEYSSTTGLYIVRSSTTCELNATTISGNPVYNWFSPNSSAQDRSDTGCQWLFTDVTDVEVKAEPDPINVVTGTAQEGAAELVDGHVYTITNHQKSGTCYPFYTDNNALQYGSANALAAKSYGDRAKFTAIKKGTDIFAFKNVATDMYLVWKGKNSGANNNTGLQEAYDSIYCCFKITSVTSVTNGKILTSKRSDGSTDGTFVQASSGTWDAWKGTSLCYNDNYSNVYTFGDVTNGTDGEGVTEEKQDSVISKDSTKTETEEVTPDTIKVVTGTAQVGSAELVDGHVYTITNHQKSGTCYAFYTDDNKTLQYGSANALAAKSYGNRAKFTAIKKGTDIFAFKNIATNKYLVWKGSSSGTNSNTGLLETYDSIYCCFKLTSASAVTNGKLLSAKRSDGSTDGTFSQASSGTWDAWMGTSQCYNDNYSNVYTFGDVTDGDDGEIVDEEKQDSVISKDSTKTQVITQDTLWATGLDWYTMRIGAAGLYISNPTGSNISLTTSKTEFADADLWLRTGNDTDGYTIYNKEAGPSKVLAAPTTMTGDEGGTSYPIMVHKDSIPSGYTATWIFSESSDLGSDTESWYISEKDNASNIMNNRNSILAFWSGGKDAGSSIQWTWAQRTVAVNMSTGTFTAGNSNYAQVWTSTATEPQLTINAGWNNMTVASSNDTCLQTMVGQFSPQTYTITAGTDYSIAGYCFNFVMAASTAITVTDAEGNQFTSSADVQSVNCQGLTETSTSFTLSGANAGVNLTNFLVTIRKAITPAEEQFDLFPTLTTAAIPYRIPAIATAYDGTVVAVADYRYSRADIGSGRIDLHIRRSHDNGATWDDIMTPEVMTGDGNTTEGNQKAGYGDPCIVGDRESSRMMITSCSGTPGFFGGTRTHHQGWARWYSEDNGATWGEPTYLDEEFIYSKFDNSAYGPIKGWFVGSGKICQSTKTKVGSYYRLYCVGSSYNGSQTANWALYSDDFGETWEFLGGCDNSPVPGGDEPKAEELPDGSILLSSRTTGGRNFNIFTFTDTEKAQGSWSTVAFSGSGNNGVIAVSNACNGEVMLVPVTRKADNTKMFLLLQSVPFGSGRTNVGIYYKELESLADYRTPTAIAKDWDGRHQSSYISSAYSTMTWQKNNTIGFVYEEDTYGTSGGGYNIVYKNYSIEQITDSAYTYCASVDGDSLTALGMQEVVGDMTDAANVGPIVGQYTSDAIDVINNAYKEYSAAPTRKKYEALNSAMASAPRVEITDTCYYTIRNYGRGTQNYVLNASSSTVLSVSTDASSDASLWYFKEASDGTYYLVNKAFPDYMVGPTLGVEVRSVLTNTQSSAGTFSVSSTTEGLSVIKCTNPTNSGYPCLHLAGDVTRIVPWVASAGASMWYIEATDVPTGIEGITAGLDSLIPVSDACYDLNGRPVDLPQKGQIYIRRGKKFLCK